MQDKYMERFLSTPPDDIINPIYNHQYCSSYHFEYCLFENKIYYRTCTPENPMEFIRGDLVSPLDSSNVLEWKLLDNIGIPYDKRMKSLLKDGELLVEIAVASDNLVAVSNLDQVYLFKPTEKNRPLYWESLLGAPDIFRDKLYLPHNRKSWALSCSVCDKPKIRNTSFIHPKEKVTYFEDAQGVRFDFGFTLTLYVLVGNIIFYWDTGLPASYSRGFMVPQGLQGISISAAGSTVFLSAVDSQGTLHYFTRMIDYEINGACPGLKITYKQSPAVYPPGGAKNSFFLGKGVRQMPLAGWLEHSLEGIIDHVTDKVTIRLTGQGNKARELRIQGYEPELGWGYYSKQITESKWVFNPDPMAAPKPSDPLDEPVFNPDLPTSRLTYHMQTQSNSEPTLSIEGFNPFITDAEPFELVISYPDEPIERVKIHAVDAWGLHYHFKHDEALVGSIDGEPKALVATLILSSEQLDMAQHAQSKTGCYLKSHFINWHEKTKAIPIIADNGMIILEIDSLNLHFSRTPSQAEINDSYYMQRAMENELTTYPINYKECKELIKLNRHCLKDIKSIYLTRRLEDGKYTFLNKDVSLMRSLTSIFFKVFYTPEDPTYQQAIKDLKLLLEVHKKATAYSALGKGHALGYEKARITLKNRINNLRQLAETLPNQSRLNVEEGSCTLNSLPSC